MDNSYPAKLHLHALLLQEPLHEDLKCSLSLIKGTHHYGTVPFKLFAGQQLFKFAQSDIINFYFVPRTINRKDVFFKIVLSDVDADEQISDIPISTSMLVESFSKNRNQVIEKEEELAEGVLLRYSIFQPKIEIIKPHEKIGFKKVKHDDFLNSIFSRPEVKPLQPRRQPAPVSVPAPPSFPSPFEVTPLSASILEPTPPPSQVPNIFKEPSQEEQKKLAIMNLVNLMKPKDSKPAPSNENEEMDHLSLKNRRSSEQADDLMANLFSFMKESNISQQKKKHTLMPAHQGHHTVKVMSLKMKVVIFLLLLGLVLLGLDTLQDRKVEATRKVIRQGIQKIKSKKKKAKSVVKGLEGDLLENL